MPRSPSPAAGGGLPKDQTKSCPVEALAREVKAINDICNRLAYDDINRDVANGRLFLLNDQRDWIEDQVSRLLTRSGLGAIMQIQMILADAETMSSWIPEGSEGAEMRNRWMNSIERMAYSLVAFIEAATGAKAEDASCDYYMPRDHNPNLRLAKALAA